MSSSAWLVYVKGKTLGSGISAPKRKVPHTEILAYFRMLDGRIVAPREQEDYKRLLDNPDAEELV